MELSDSLSRAMENRGMTGAEQNQMRERLERERAAPDGFSKRELALTLAFVISIVLGLAAGGFAASKVNSRSTDPPS